MSINPPFPAFLNSNRLLATPKRLHDTAALDPGRLHVFDASATTTNGRRRRASPAREHLPESVSIPVTNIHRGPGHHDAGGILNAPPTCLVLADDLRKDEANAPSPRGITAISARRRDPAPPPSPERLFQWRKRSVAAFDLYASGDPNGKAGDLNLKYFGGDLQRGSPRPITAPWRRLRSRVPDRSHRVRRARATSMNPACRSRRWPDVTFRPAFPRHPRCLRDPRLRLHTSALTGVNPPRQHGSQYVYTPDGAT